MRSLVPLAIIVLAVGTLWAANNPAAADRFYTRATATASNAGSGAMGILREMANCDEPRRRRRGGWSRALICR